MFEENYQQECRLKAIQFGERYGLNNDQLKQMFNDEDRIPDDLYKQIMTKTMRRSKVKQYQVYILECEDGSYYTGIAIDPDKRFKQHISGKGAKYTRSHKPVKIVLRSVPMNKSSALKLEYRIKQLSHEQKKILVVDRQGSISRYYMGKLYEGIVV